jgi:putative ubiquitin-RnfH superfamily antitoxin RatB of RatAB toxin-antitoxin module
MAMVNEPSVIEVSIAWGVAGRADELVMTTKEGTTIADLLASASVRENLPASILADTAGHGVWGKVRLLTYTLRDGDRVELYRPLRADPKEQRRKRAG